MKFADFRAPVKALFVLLVIGTLIGILQIVLYPPLGPASAIARLIDIPIVLFVLYGVFARLKVAYWLLVITNSLSLLSLALKIGFATRLGGMSKELIGTLLLYYAIPVIIFSLAFTYGVRRHFRLIDRKNEN